VGGTKSAHYYMVETSVMQAWASWTNNLI